MPTYQKTVMSDDRKITKDYIPNTFAPNCDNEYFTLGMIIAGLRNGVFNTSMLPPEVNEMLNNYRPISKGTSTDRKIEMSDIEEAKKHLDAPEKLVGQIGSNGKGGKINMSDIEEAKKHLDALELVGLAGSDGKGGKINMSDIEEAKKHLDALEKLVGQIGSNGKGFNTDMHYDKESQEQSGGKSAKSYPVDPFGNELLFLVKYPEKVLENHAKIVKREGMDPSKDVYIVGITNNTSSDITHEIKEGFAWASKMVVHPLLCGWINKDGLEYLDVIIPMQFNNDQEAAKFAGSPEFYQEATLVLRVNGKYTLLDSIDESGKRIDKERDKEFKI